MLPLRDTLQLEIQTKTTPYNQLQVNKSSKFIDKRSLTGFYLHKNINIKLSMVKNTDHRKFPC